MASRSSVFISYAHDTKPWARELTRALESQGIEAWVDFKDLRPGQRWKEELDRAIGAARWLLILVGPGDRATAWQETEWSAALARSWADSDKHLLPVVFGDTEPPPFLRNWVSLRVNPDQEPTSWTSHVLDALRGFGSEAVHGEDRRERQQRFDEIGKAAEDLREGQQDEPPIELEVRP